MGTNDESTSALIGRAEQGEKIMFVHFWRHHPQQEGRVDAACFSQWWPSPFTVDGIAYATAEHWMMAEKARLFGDGEAERRALEATSPAAAQKAGRLVSGFDEETWRTHRYGIVLAGSLHKFGRDPELRAYLLGTGDHVLVEASPVDRIWGIGLAEDAEAAHDPARWRGLNLLGFALMEARERLRADGGAEAGTA
ncbi:NADAR family protein [Streptomyces sp. NPDC048639]|uniref:NADAR family protein n=1 Tax=Streptomyces sp. NPDC048639 TaxID=3365581 RepID=UPI00371A48FB